MSTKDRIEEYYLRLKEGKEDYFKLMGVDQNVLLSQLEEIYKDLKDEFAIPRLSSQLNHGSKKKLQYINSRIDRIYFVLYNYEQRERYERMGNRDIKPEDLKEPDNIEKARQRFQAGESLTEKQDFPRAIEAFRKAIFLDPHKAIYYYKLGKCQMKIHSLRREAQINFDKCIELENWNAEYWAIQGHLFYIEKLYKKAEPFLREAVKLDPNHRLAKKLLNEIAPEPKTNVLSSLHRSMGKVMPSFFKPKKK
jgi:tetratricopeptide (TPR) repeat protein